MSRREITPERFAVYWVDLEPTRGSEIRKTRPCVVVSPDEMNAHLQHVIVAPMTTKIKNYPFRVSCSFDKVRQSVACDHLRSVDVSRLNNKIGVLSPAAQGRLSAVLVQIFA